MNQPIKSALTQITERFKSPISPLFGDCEVHLHLGAHKTATTFIQNTLKSNNSILRANGVLYLPLHEMRAKNPASGKGLTNRLVSLFQANRSREDLSALRQEIREAFKPQRLQKCHTVLISEENLPLPLTGFINGGAYSALPARMKHLREEIGPKLKVFFSIRDYPDFLSSIYVEILRHHPYRSFGDFLTGLYDDLPNLWSDAYRNLVQLFGEENVTIWDFDDTVKNSGAVLSMLTGGIGDLATNKKPARSSLSQKAVEFIRDFNQLPGEPLTAPVITKVANRLYPLSQNHTKFNPWTPREYRILSEHYAAEKSLIPVKSFHPQP